MRVRSFPWLRELGPGVFPGEVTQTGPYLLLLCLFLSQHSRSWGKPLVERDLLSKTTQFRNGSKSMKENKLRQQ
jgi:hypothetical protein